MEAYTTKTRKIVDRFVRHKINFTECIVAIDAALPRIFKKIDSGQLPALRAVMLTNNARIMGERPLPTRQATQSDGA